MLLRILKKIKIITKNSINANVKSKRFFNCVLLMCYVLLNVNRYKWKQEKEKLKKGLKN